MKLKLNLTIVIFGLFLFKVGVIDSFRNFGHHSNGDLRIGNSERTKRFSIR